MEKGWSCNIDKRGRWIRGLMGMLFVGVALWLWFGRNESFWSIGIFLLGLFALFEAARGWCVLRALGIRTPY